MTCWVSQEVKSTRNMGISGTKRSLTAKFPDGIEIDIKLVICEDDTPYTEGVLFQNGCEQAGTEPGCAYDGKWTFHFKGTEYIVIVEVEK